MRGVRIPRTRQTAVALTCALVVSAGAVIGGTTIAILHRDGFDAGPAAAVAAFPPTITAQPALIGKAAIIFDPTDGRILFQKNADMQLPLASITKLMTADIVLTAESPDTRVTITPSALAPEEGSGLKVGDVVTLGELLRLGLVASSNDAMQAAAESLGANYIDRMNRTARDLGFTETYFRNPTGLDVSADTSGAYSSAYDVARLAALFYKQYPTLFEQTQQSSVSIHVGDRVLTKPATAAPLLTTPGLIGAKTGYTTLAGGNLVAVFDREIDHPLVAVVLGSTRDGRFDDMQTLISIARKN